jgi:uncharacterized membrane protein YccC
MNIYDVLLGAWIGILVSTIAWSLWGVHVLERQWQKAFGEQKQQPTVKELLDDADKQGEE